MLSLDKPIQQDLNTIQMLRTPKYVSILLSEPQTYASSFQGCIST